MFERFTERARRAVVLAQEEARDLKHDFVGTEHMLLGLLRVQEGVAARALGALGVRYEEVHNQVARIVGPGNTAPVGPIPFTPRSKRALELALADALSFGHDYIGTEHLLLGVARVDEGVAATVLNIFGVHVDRIREEVRSLLGGQAVAAGAGSPWGSSYPRPVPGRREGPPRLQPSVSGGRWKALGSSLWATLGLAVGVLLGRLIWG